MGARRPEAGVLDPPNLDHRRKVAYLSPEAVKLKNWPGWTQSDFAFPDTGRGAPATISTPRP